MDDFLEASYPSSYTLMTICICGSSIFINKKLFNNKIIKVINCLSIIIFTITVVGRLISGVHWFTDIVGGILISIGKISQTEHLCITNLVSVYNKYYHFPFLKIFDFWEMICYNIFEVEKYEINKKRIS